MDSKLCSSLGRLAAICETVTPGLDVHQVMQSPATYLSPAVGALEERPQDERVGALLEAVGRPLPSAALTTTDGAYFFYSGYYSEKSAAK